MAYDPVLADRICAVLARTCPFVEKKMFGGVAYMVNGRMCCGVFKSDIMLRLGPEAAAAALNQKHVRRMDFTGKPMKGMVCVEPHGVERDDALETWIHLAVAFARSPAALPAPKTRAKPQASSAKKPSA